MARHNVLSNFLKKPSGKTVIISLMLYFFEDNMDSEFVCPCKEVQNIVTSLLYAVGPSVVSFIMSYHVMDYFREIDCNQNKFLYSVLTSVVWMVFCLIDGRYLTCALSGLEGKYVKTDKWCKPSDVNTTFLFESEHKAQVLMSLSQIIGFGVMILASFIYAFIACCCKNNQQNPNGVQMDVMMVQNNDV